jgi:hypothetical protein
MDFTFLPNSRWLCLSSDDFGRDWLEKSWQIDDYVESLGLDHIQEDVYLFYNESPSDLLKGKGECVIGRSVSGPKKDLNFPFKFLDWSSRPVITYPLKGGSLEQYLESALEKRTALELQGRGLKTSFILRIRRQLNPELKVSVEVIFYE